MSNSTPPPSQGADDEQSHDESQDEPQHEPHLPLGFAEAAARAAEISATIAKNAPMGIALESMRQRLDAFKHFPRSRLRIPPDLNLTNPQVTAQMETNRILRETQQQSARTDRTSIRWTKLNVLLAAAALIATTWAAVVTYLLFLRSP